MSLKESIALSPTIGKINDSFQQAEPTVCIVLGILGSAAAVYLAWQAGRKTDEVIEEIKNDISEVREKRPKEVTEAPTGRTFYVVEEGQVEKKEYNKMFLKVVTSAAIKVGKLFAPAIITEIGSIAFIGYGTGQISERAAAATELAATYAGVLVSYRDRVKSYVGEEKERQIYYGMHEETIEEPELGKNGEPKVTKDGKPKMKKTVVTVLDEELAKHSPFARIFSPDFTYEFGRDELTGEEDIWYNGKMIKDVERYYNNIIQYSPYHIVTLNDIYSHLGMDLSADGQSIGWHGHKDRKTGEFIFDCGGPEGIKIQAFPIWYHDEVDGSLKKAYIMDFNVTKDNNILKFYPKIQRKVKDINGKI